MRVDLAIENARIVDGTGAPWYHGTIGVREGTLTSVTTEPTPALDPDVRIDADGLVVSPGFIDTHSHSDLVVFDDPTLEPKTRQGITTEILGQDGFSMAPMHREDGPTVWQDHLRGLAGDVDINWTWDDTESYFQAIEANGVGPNVGMLVGHGTVRYNAMGMTDRAPTPTELTTMQDLVTDSLDAGAIGLSTGLVYAPQVNADTDELIALASTLHPYGRPFVAHIRSEGRWLWDALTEFVHVGTHTNVPLHLSHYKVAGPEQHHKATQANAFLEITRERGIDITAEQYPYTASNTLLSAVLPPWVHADTPDHARTHLQDPDARERIRRDIEEWRIDGWENQGARTGWDNLVVTGLESPAYAAYDGMTVADIAADHDTHPVSTVCDILDTEDFRPGMIGHIMHEDDVRTILTNERVNVATDGLFGPTPHPRTYGTYPRVLGRYVREHNLLSLEAAVRKMTSLPARVMGLPHKGVLRPGLDADLVVFDPATVTDNGTFDDPAQFPTGIHHVIVNGTFVVDDGTTTGNTPGQVIRQPPPPTD